MATERLQVILEMVTGQYKREAREAATSTQQIAQAADSAITSTEQLGSTARSTSTHWGRFAVGVAGAVGALVSVREVLSAGWDRFTAIQDATRALEIQLQDTAAAGELMQDVLDTVRGTPFNLDQFASAAQRLVGFGVEAERIPRILSAIGEASATQGERAGEFVDRLVMVFGQIEALGRVTGEHMNRLGEAGVNALAILANSFGVTTEEMRKMISQGAVPAEDAITALANGIIEGTEGAAGSTVALGGTMEGLRETLTGARGGLNAAVARLGESLVGLSSEGLLAFFNSLSTELDNVTGSITAASEASEQAGPGFLGRTFGNLPTALGIIREQFTGVFGVAKGFGDSLVSLSHLDFSGFTADIEAMGDAFNTAASQMDFRAIQIGLEADLASGLVEAEDRVYAFANALVDLSEAGLLTEGTARAVAGLTRIDPSRMAEGYRLAAIALGAMTDPTNVQGINVLTEGMEDTSDAVAGMTNDLDAADRAMLNVSQQGGREAARILRDVANAAGEGGPNLREMAAATRDVADAMREAADPVFAAVEATKRLQEAEQTYQDLLADPEASGEDIASAWLDIAEARLDANAALAELGSGNKEAGIRAIADALEISYGQAKNLLDTWNLFDDAGDIRKEINIDMRPEDRRLLENALYGGPVTVPVRTSTAGGAQVGASPHNLGRQHGGPVTAGRPYVVGEAGPEVVIPNQSGLVLSNFDSRSLLDAVSRGGGDFVVHMERSEPHTDAQLLGALRSVQRRMETL